MCSALVLYPVWFFAGTLFGFCFLWKGTIRFCGCCPLLVFSGFVCLLHVIPLVYLLLMRLKRALSSLVFCAANSSWSFMYSALDSTNFASSMIISSRATVCCIERVLIFSFSASILAASSSKCVSVSRLLGSWTKVARSFFCCTSRCSMTRTWSEYWRSMSLKLCFASWRDRSSFLLRLWDSASSSLTVSMLRAVVCSARVISRMRFRTVSSCWRILRSGILMSSARFLSLSSIV